MYKKNIFFLFISLLIMVLFYYLSLNFRIDASSDTLVSQKDEDFKYFNYYNKIFPSNQFLVLAVKSKNDINENYIENISSITKKITNLDQVDDVLNINNHFIIGLSNRTNRLGATNLAIILKSLGATVKICRTPTDILHFKSECSLIDDETILVSQRMNTLDYLKSNYNLITLPLGEENAANALRINNNLLIQDGYNYAEEILSKKYNIIKIRAKEISKVDAGLSCMSLRW